MLVAPKFDEGGPNEESYGDLRSDMLGGIDPNDNVLRDLFGAAGELLGVGPKYGNYNRMNSPGEKFLIQDGEPP